SLPPRPARSPCRWGGQFAGRSFAQAVGDAETARRHLGAAQVATFLDQVLHHLPDEEGVAIGFAMDDIHDPFTRLSASRVRKWFRGLAATQTGKQDPIEEPLAALRRERVGQRPRQIRCATGAGNEQRQFVELAGEVQQKQRRPIGPVRIVQHQEQAAAGGGRRRTPHTASSSA
ncbi:MAG TPA: hypothetical protein VFD32_13140, partial [Dehalococcoidia bacterium]|nr:hypothetical protein [Dehalococcoidia bacterium]